MLFQAPISGDSRSRMLGKRDRSYVYRDLVYPLYLLYLLYLNFDLKPVILLSSLPPLY